MFSEPTVPFAQVSICKHVCPDESSILGTNFSDIDTYYIAWWAFLVVYCVRMIPTYIYEMFVGTYLYQLIFNTIMFVGIAGYCLLVRNVFHRRDGSPLMRSVRNPRNINRSDFIIFKRLN
jgi:hypothetical protein